MPPPEGVVIGGRRQRIIPFFHQQIAQHSQRLRVGAAETHGPLQFRLGFLPFVESKQDGAEAVTVFGAVGTEPQRLTVFGLGSREVVGRLERVGQMSTGFRVAGIPPDGQLILAEKGLLISGGPTRLGQIPGIGGIVRRKLHGLLQQLDRLFQISRLPHRQPERLHQLGVLRLQTERLAILRRRRRMLSRAQVGIPHLDDGLEVVRLPGDDSLKFPQRTGKIARPPQRQSQQKTEIGVVGFERHRFPILADGSHQVLSDL